MTKDFIDIEHHNPEGHQEKFNQILLAKQAQANQTKKPYCTACAKMDYDQAVKRLEAEIISLPTNQRKNVRISFDPNQTEYSQFELKGTSQKRDDRILDGRRHKTLVTFQDWRCTKRGHGWSTIVEEPEQPSPQKKTK